ncbi:MAG: efflux RND transporter permease subunit, partial [Pseudomonadota bacterium]
DLDENGMPDVDDSQLRMLGYDVLQSLNQLPNTSAGFVVGGRQEQVKVEVLPERLAGYGISLGEVAETIKTANAELQAGGVEAGDTHFTVVTGSFLRTVEDISELVVGTFNDVPVYIHDVARVSQAPEDAKQIVTYYTGPAADGDDPVKGAPAVTIAIAKKEGTNGVTVASAVIDRVDELMGKLIPTNVDFAITRNYGETARDKVNELIGKLFKATGFVFVLVLLAFFAFRPALVVVLVIPVVLLMTIFVAWVWGYTIDRVSLFALIFSIGILVDDAIVVVENIYRRWLEKGETDVVTAVDAVREVGNPTILATFTVIGALLPMGFVSGMMGPYMEPIPALGSVAMLISLFAAFVFTPWLAMSPWLRPSMHYLTSAAKREHREADWLGRFYARILNPLIDSTFRRRMFRLAMWGSLVLAMSLFYYKGVAVKMLPLDNKPEFSVVLDMPEGTALPVTANVAGIMTDTILKMSEVTAVQTYVGTAKPYDFNGMVRHYYLRSRPWQAELQVQLLHKNDRDRSSHEIAVEVRETLQPLVAGTGAKLTVVEMPPGPPVLQSVVAEVHGPDAVTRRQVADDLTKVFEEAESLADVDNYMLAPFDYWRFSVDDEKASRRGISVDSINHNLSMALGSVPLGDVKQRAGQEPIRIVMQVPLAERSQVTRLGDLPIQNMAGLTVPLRELGRFEKVLEDDTIFHKDLRGVEYVVADVGGHLAAPVYGMMQVEQLLNEEEYITPDGALLGERTFWMGPPASDMQSGIEWSGEWTVTFETFRDMGAAFAVALLLIYMLVVWEFGNFRIPALIMAPIPLTLLGIIPAHMIVFQMGFGGEFTATSMIGWIALAGIIVRNSILLVDFSIHEVQKGVPVREAVIKACKTRTRPILITALALVAGSSVILTDPIFQGMAISLASGVMVSTILTLVVIPLGTIEAKKSLYEVAAAGMPAGETLHIPQEDVEIVGAPKPGGIQGAVATLAKIGGILLMVFYALRGIGLLLLSLIRKLYRKLAAKAALPPTSPPASSTGGAGPAGPAGMPPSPGGLPGAGGMAKAQPAAAVPARAREAPVPVPRAEPAGVRARAPVLRPRKPRVLTEEDRARILSGPERIDMLRGVAEGEVIETSVASDDELAVISAPIAKPGGGPAASVVPEKPAAARVSDKITLRGAGAREARREIREERAEPEKPAAPKAATPEPRPRREAPSKPAPAAGTATEPEARAKKPGRKGGGRRGIRLKDKLPSNKDMGLN